MKTLILLLAFLNVAHATYDPSLQNLQLDMMYSAKISSAGVVSDENKDWINGNCAVTATNHFDCTYNTAIFTVAPNCIIKDQAVAQTGGFSVLFDNSSSSATHAVYNTYSGVALPYGADPRAVNIVCQKQGVDYLTASSAVYSVQNQNTDMVSYSPNVSSPGILTNSGKWRRVGDMMEIEVYVEWNGSGGGGGLLVDIPSGYTIDTAKLANTPGSRLGGGQWLDSGTAYYDVSVVYSDTNSVRFMQTGGASYLDGSAFASGDQMKFNIMVPITGWTAAPFAIASIAGYGSAPGVAGSANQSVDSFTVSYGTTAATTVCSASPCSYLDQIGTAVTSVTRSATGVYSLNTARTYAKLKCSSNSVGSAYTVNSSINCSSCNAVTFATVLSTTGANTDTYGTLYCQGNY